MEYLLGYLVIAFISYGFIFNFWQEFFTSRSDKEKGYKDDMRFSILMGVLWFAGIPLLLSSSIKHGIKLRFKFK